MILNILKPEGITSHDVVDKVRRLTGEKRVGHGGTLDPFASGVLVIGVGRESTKKLREILKEGDKEYAATLCLGKESTTDDREGEIKTAASDKEIAAITKERLAMTFHKFRGEIEQIPPAYSAVKLKGEPAYKLARRGETPDLPERTVTIKELELLDFRPPRVMIRTVVSSGTYIRALARDIGRALGVGAYLEELVRIRVGGFKIEDSRTLEEIEKLLKNENTKN